MIAQRRYAQNSAVQARSARAKVAAAGGIKAVMAAMNAHLGDVGVQKNGRGALFNIAAENRAKVENAGGQSAAEEAMRRHPSDEGVQMRAKALLGL